MNGRVGLIEDPEHSEGSIHRELQPPPPGQDLPSFPNDGSLDHVRAGLKNTNPIQRCAHIADHPIFSSCHPCADRSGSRSILRLRNAKHEGDAKDTPGESHRRSMDSSSGELSA